MKTRFLIPVIVLSNALGNVMLSYGMKSVGDLSRLRLPHMLTAALGAFRNPWVSAGVGLLLVFYLTYMTALSWADLTYVLPATATGYVVVAFLSRWFLHESLSATRWAGTVVIMGGVMLVIRTEVRTT